MLVSEYAVLKWNSANRKRYVDLGYSFTKWKDEFLVKIEHLTNTARAFVEVKCDYCGEIRCITYKDYITMRNRTSTNKDSCNKNECMQKKREENNIIVYGVKDASQTEEVRIKRINTIKSKYGEEYNSALEVPEIIDKIEKTNIDKYGVKNTFASEEIKNKIIETNLMRYGVEYYTQTDEYIKKSEDTNMKKYGVKRYSQTKEFRRNNSGKNNTQWKGGTTDLSRYLRSYLNDWKKESFKLCNYRCMITNEKSDGKFHVHHLYSVNLIIRDIINDIDLELEQVIGNYSSEELNKITDLFIKKNNEIYGVVLRPDIHNLFHSIYGKGNNTPEQFEEFKYRYNFGEFKEVI